MRKKLFLLLTLFAFLFGCAQEPAQESFQSLSNEETSFTAFGSCNEYTAKNTVHVEQGRAEVYLLYGFLKYAKTKGAGDDLGSLGSVYYSATTTVAETSPGYFIKGKCPVVVGNANLNALALAEAPLSPAFSSDKTEYQASVPNEITKITLSATPADPAASVAISGNTENLAVGGNLIEILVTDTQSNQKIYQILVTRAAVAEKTSLKSLLIQEAALSPAFDPAKTAYTASVAHTVTSVTVTAIAEDPAAQVTVSGNTQNLSIGTNLIQITVTDTLGNQKMYSITLTRADNAVLYQPEDFASIGDASEGIAFDNKGNMFVTSSKKGLILKISAAGVVDKNPFASGLNTPEAIAFDKGGNLWVAEYGGYVKQFSPSGVLLDSFSGFNGPNGLAVHSNGTVFFSCTGSRDVYQIQNRKVTSLFKIGSAYVSSPNGMALSRDEKTLYIVELQQASYFGVAGAIHKVTLDASANYVSKTKLTPSQSLPTLDGIAIDVNGQLYVSYNKKDIARVNPETGAVTVLYQSSKVGSDLSWPANIAFGAGTGFDPETLYITQVGIAVGETPTENNQKIKKMYMGVAGMKMPVFGN